eukprot:6931908-Karenia_brevis.AAC.1
MRRERSHAAHRASSNPFTDSPDGNIPEYAIKGELLEKGHEVMVKNFQAKPTPPKPTVMDTPWITKAKAKW